MDSDSRLNANTLAIGVTKVNWEDAGEAIPGLLNDIVVTHILRSEYFDDPADLARLPAVSRAMRDAVAAKVGRLVLVITREQEQQGLMYDGSQPFVLNGRKFHPMVRGVWFVPPGKGYAREQLTVGRRDVLRSGGGRAHPCTRVGTCERLPVSHEHVSIGGGVSSR